MNESSRFNRVDANKFTAKLKSLYMKNSDIKPAPQVSLVKTMADEKKKALFIVNQTNWMFETKSNPRDQVHRMGYIGKGFRSI